MQAKAKEAVKRCPLLARYGQRAATTLSHGTSRRIAADCAIMVLAALAEALAFFLAAAGTAAASINHRSVFGSTIW